MKKLLSIILTLTVSLIMSMVVFSTNVIAATSAYTQIEAEVFSTQLGTITGACSEGGSKIGSTDNGDYLVYNGIDFGTGATSFEARVASPITGGKVELRLDSINGTLIGTLNVTDTGSWTTWATESVTVSGASGVHNLYVKFVDSGDGICDLNWFKFIGNGTPLPVSNKLEAESATLYGAQTLNSSSYSNGAFVDYVNASGDYIEWTYTAPTTKMYYLKFTFVNSGTSDRPLKIEVNGQVVTSSLSFSSTAGAFATVIQPATLTQGVNKIRATAISSSGPNMDYLTVSTVGTGSGDRYVSLNGSGSKDGTSLGNAMPGNVAGGLQEAWDATGSSNTLFLASGTYDVEQSIVIGTFNDGTSSSAKKKLIGVSTDATGFPSFIGKWSQSNDIKVNLISMGVGSSYLHFQDIKVQSYNSAIWGNGKNVSIYVKNVDTNKCCDSIYLWGGSVGVDSAKAAAKQYATDGSNDILIEDCDMTNYARRGFRLRGGVFNVTFRRCVADGGGVANWNTFNWQAGFGISDHAYDNTGIYDYNITHEDCVSNNNYTEVNTGSLYWNGDGFAPETETDNISYYRCIANNNTDGGWDVKSKRVTLNDCVSMRNKRAYRSWSREGAVLTNCIGAYSNYWGGSTTHCGLWSAGIITLNKCTFFNNSGNEIISEGLGAVLTANNCIIGQNNSTVDDLLNAVDGGVININSCNLYVKDVKGIDPRFINPTQSWDGYGTNWNSQQYTTTKGYYK